jgi:ABC-type hemin transport system ATPase subunit
MYLHEIGAGKSTLLAALSGTTLKSHGKKVYGAVWYEEGEDEHNLDSSTSKTGKALIDGNDANVSKSILSMR